MVMELIIVVVVSLWRREPHWVAVVVHLQHCVKEEEEEEEEEEEGLLWMNM
jgi:hypothetical protein